MGATNFYQSHSQCSIGMWDIVLNKILLKKLDNQEHYHVCFVGFMCNVIELVVDAKLAPYNLVNYTELRDRHRKLQYTTLTFTMDLSLQDPLYIMIYW